MPDLYDYYGYYIGVFLPSLQTCDDSDYNSFNNSRLYIDSCLLLVLEKNEKEIIVLNSPMGFCIARMGITET